MTEKKKPVISIVIPTALERVVYLTECLTRIHDHTKIPYEIIVVLDGEQPQSKTIAEGQGATVVQHDEQMGFGEAMNSGFEVAQGEYLVCLNNDVLLVDDWDIIFQDIIDNHHKSSSYPRTGMVGPFSNFAGGVQGRSVQGLNPSNVNEYSQEFYNQNSDRVLSHAFISGFCFMMPREFYEERIEEDGFFFDPRFPIGGAEDNDLCVRAVRAGWNLSVAPVYVFHYGSKTLSEYKEEVAGGLKNLYHLYKKYEDQTKDEKVLGALYRIKLTKDYHVDDWLRSIEKTYEFSDKIYILNDQSDKDLWERAFSYIEENYGDKIQPVIHRDKKKLEGIDRQELYEAAFYDGCDWVISIDGDEVFEDKFDRAYAQRLMNNPTPQVNGYAFHWYHLWNDEDYWRADGQRGFTTGVRMQRCVPNFYIPKKAFHVGNVPMLPGGCQQQTSIRIKHYGQLRKEERERKKEFYNKNDQEKDPELIGQTNYDHIADETMVQILPWQEDNEISIVTIMKDEETHLHRYLSNYWAFADEIVIVDTGSSDRSVELAKLFGVKVIDQEWEDDFSKPRNTALKHATKDWILHLDIDENLPGLHKVRRMTEWPAADGFVFDIFNQLPDGRKVISNTVRLMRNNGKWYYTRKIHETVDESWKQNGFKVMPATTHIDHSGFMKDQSTMKKKLGNYFRMNLRELVSNPKDASANYNTAMHFLEAGYRKIGTYLVERAVSLNPGFIQAVNELVQCRVHDALALVNHSKKVIPESNQKMHAMFDHNLRALNQVYEEKRPIDISHVNEVLKEEEFKEVGQKLAMIAEKTNGGGVVGGTD